MNEQGALIETEEAKLLRELKEMTTFVPASVRSGSHTISVRWRDTAEQALKAVNARRKPKIDALRSLHAALRAYGQK